MGDWEGPAGGGGEDISEAGEVYFFILMVNTGVHLLGIHGAVHLGRVSLSSCECVSHIHGVDGVGARRPPTLCSSFPLGSGLGFVSVCISLSPFNIFVFLLGREREHKQEEPQAEGDAGSPLSRESDRMLDPGTQGS